MLIWFLGASVAVVWLVFRSPALDYRLVMAGAVLPVGEAAFGGPRVLHTLAACVAVLVVVMACTRRRRLVRRRWLGLPIGLFLHLLLDASWTRTRLFWWPLFGASFGTGQVPELTRGIFGWMLELAGVALLVAMARHFNLDEPGQRHAFLRAGQLPRHVVHGRGP